MLVGEVAVARGDRAPAGEQVPEPFDDGRPCSDLGDEDSRLGVVETVRDCFVSEGGAAGAALVKLSVKYF